MPAMRQRDYARLMGGGHCHAKGKGKAEKPPMNGTEASYAEFLEVEKAAGRVLWFKFAPMSIKVAEGVHYRPDFLVLFADETLAIVDVKGRASDKRAKATGLGFFTTDDAWPKIKTVADMFPFRMLVVWPAKGKGNSWEQLEV